ncbi:hypothetical protein J5277_09660 [Rhizobium sp. 16-449-1b]|uniref:hypothetical protein n=1 Tax=Rhizobium sp. 16-449-1b TaxID=2819989 RepID=UPI001ADC3CB6|nr:hypothetical protein [Rhizobium sp. 16-449-1b]MBO9194371.1 hypothetical protein [Rhizobium sp. 16-449-1b]
MSQCDCQFFEEGDLVECKLNTELFGIIISESDFGRYYQVQLFGSLEVKPFHWATLRHVEQEGQPPLQHASDPDDTNVVRVDFTKGRELKPDTETEGAA